MKHTIKREDIYTSKRRTLFYNELAGAYGGGEYKSLCLMTNLATLKASFVVKEKGLLAFESNNLDEAIDYYNSI